jgi:pilus assembly protein Flp/PilA
MRKLWQDRLRDTSGAAQVEYGLLLALIALVIVGYLSTIGSGLAAKYAIIAQALQ